MKDLTDEQQAALDTVAAKLERMIETRDTAAAALAEYRASLLDAYSVGVQQADVVRRTGRNRDTVRLDADPDARKARIARRAKPTE
jgi:Tfp pilus assembly protein PilE